jgi:hypothetical protein
MGTSGAYGGSAGFGPVRDPIAEWVGGGDAPPAGGGGPGGPPDGERPDGNDTDRPAPPPPQVARSLAALGRAISYGSTAAGASGRGPAVRTGRSGGGGGGGRTRSGGRTTGRASASGGSAVAAGYASRVGGAAPVPGTDMTAEELARRTPMQQAALIVGVAAPDGPPDGDDNPFHDEEIRRANGQFAEWIIAQETAPSPADTVRRWVVEYTWQVWLREVGQQLRQIADPREMQRRETRMRTYLEARVAALDVRTTGVTQDDFRTAIDTCFGSLARVFDEEAP